MGDGDSFLPGEIILKIRRPPHTSGHCKYASSGRRSSINVQRSTPESHIQSPSAHPTSSARKCYAREDRLTDETPGRGWEKSGALQLNINQLFTRCLLYEQW